ncbi:Interleukin-17C [Merluccius polli]|uniref:Interleukin-17C n=1 Tax=Merluccius polli TaxID=89951 RepID=A0AA47P9G1_MERPO|nr:Interleukin-17C [Merluccius polli]
MSIHMFHTQLLVVLLGVSCVAVRANASHCYDEEQLEERAQKELKRLHQHFLDPKPEPAGPAAAPGGRCPVGLYAGLSSQPLHTRSISPWRYVYDTDKDRFPRRISVAECLCGGCITLRPGEDTAAEDFTYLSAAVLQHRLVLKKELCKDGRYRLVPHDQAVAVGCTCATPNY